MDSMPDNILLHVFYALNRESLCLGVRMTCTRWRQLTFDPSLWRYLAIPEHYTDTRVNMLLNQVHEHVEELEMSNCNCLTSDGFIRFATDLKFPRLKKIAVPITTTLPDNVFHQLAKVCPVLEETENIRSTYSGECSPLSCQQLFPGIQVLHDRPVSTYGRLRKSLTQQDATKRKHWVSDLVDVAKACPEISKYSCNRGMEFINGDGLSTISSTFPNLRSLELRNCTVDDESLERFFASNERYGGLSEINFDKPGPVTDRGLRAIADNCLSLTNIKISRCSNITNEGVQYLVNKCRDITDLHINNAVGYFEDEEERTFKDDVTDESLVHIGDKLPGLSFLRVFYSLKLSHIGLQSVVDGCPHLYGVMLFECGILEDAALTLLQKCRFIKVLILVGCDAITPRGVVNLILRAPSLARLTFYTKNTDFYDNMSDLGNDIYTQIDENSDDFRPNTVHKLALRGVGSGFLQLITVLCPNLITLDMRDKCFVSSHSLVSVLQNCEKIQNIDITSMGKADDKFLHACGSYATELRVLSLGGAVHYMSTPALCDVIKTCVSLRTLTMDVMGTDISEDMLVRTAKRYHGGHCFLYAEKDDVFAEEDHKQRYIELHFTPIKYLGSIQTIPVLETEP